MASQAAADPSMEEILASIRKIIAEDGDPGRAQQPHLAVVPGSQAAARSAAGAREDEPGPEALSEDDYGDEAEPVAAPADPANLERDMADIDEIEAALSDEEAAEGDYAETMDDDEAAGDQQPIWNADDQEAGLTSEPETEPPDAGGYGPRATPAMERLEAMMAGGVARDAAAAAGRTLLSPRSDEAVQSAFNQLADIILSEQTRTLEDLVKEMMQPMLRHWLDDNLPVLVERLVREEIERVSRGRR
jgi:cell pole-organizing protein PopZ